MDEIMTVRNICSGFQVTEIYPLDMTKLLKLENSRAKKLSSSEVITFHPMLHTPITKMSCSPSSSKNDYTVSIDCKEWKEMSSYERLSLSGQERMQVSDSSETDSVKMIIQRSHPLKDVLKYPSTHLLYIAVNHLEFLRVLKFRETQRKTKSKRGEKVIRAKKRELREGKNNQKVYLTNITVSFP